MQLEKQVCSLELAKKLKELGVKQESLFYWVHDDLTRTYLATEKQLPIIQAGYNRIPHQSMAEDYGWRENVEKCSAFTVAELGEMLPRFIADADQPLSGVKGKQYPLIIECLADDYSSDNKINGWRIRYGDTKVKIDSEPKLNSAGIYYVGTEADARAKMLIYLLENKLITL